jgi:hypothetical protein
MLTQIAYAQWRRQIRPAHAPANSDPNPVWVFKGTITRAVCPERAREFVQIAQRQQFRVHVPDSANL